MNKKQMADEWLNANKDIAADFGFKIVRLSNIDYKKKKAFKMHGKAWKTSEVKTLESMLDEGHSIPEIAAFLQRSCIAVNAQAIRLKLVDPVTDYQQMCWRHPKYPARIWFYTQLLELDKNAMNKILERQ